MPSIVSGNYTRNNTFIYCFNASDISVHVVAMGSRFRTNYGQNHPAGITLADVCIIQLDRQRALYCTRKDISISYSGNTTHNRVNLSLHFTGDKPIMAWWHNGYDSFIIAKKGVKKIDDGCQVWRADIDQNTNDD